MPLTTGTRLGPYDVIAAIGSGGMGEVYRARDIKLNRDVALKVLPEEFAADADRLARFKREAQVLATLNHPNIAAIYGLEEADGVRALVLELVEGVTLVELLDSALDAAPRSGAARQAVGVGPHGESRKAGPLPLDEALPIAKQIAEALEAAHEHGIIHRDLKPANVKLRPDGTVKVLDFGLAKIMEDVGRVLPSGPAGAAGSTEQDSAYVLSQSPTMSVAATRAGIILGTAAYMSPEQARGKAVDKRTDIWAFGCVLYEMLAGRRAFEGDDVSDVIATVLKGEPDWSALPAELQPAIRTLVQRCLAKDRNQRIADISTAHFLLTESASLASSAAAASAQPATVPGKTSWRRVATQVGTAIVASTVAGVAVWFAARPILPPPRVSRFTITPSSAAALTISGVDRDLAITPDGTHVVYVGANGSALFVRALDQLDAMRLAGGAPRGLFLSPDGQWIGFVDGTTALKKVALSGGPAVMVGRLDGAGPRGATWGPDDTIVFATSTLATGLQWIPAAGGEPTVLTRPNRERGEADHMWPEFLPGGQAVLFTITATTGGLDAASVAALDLRTGGQTVLIRGGSHAHYVRSGHLVYGAAGTLRAVPFDLAHLAVVGPPVPVLSQVPTTPQGAVDAVIADDGTLVYVTGSVAATERTLVWVDRQGQETPIAAPPRVYVYPRLAPDGTRIAVSIRDQEDDIWLWDLARATLTRVTFDPGLDSYPVWTRDSQRLLFSSERAGARSLFGQAADGTGAVERLTESPNAQDSTAMSPDGTRLVFTESEDLMTLSLDRARPSARPTSSGSTVSSVERSTSSKRGEPVEPRRAAPPMQGAGTPGRSPQGEVRPLIQTAFAERNGEVSPDGRWLAYEANDSGQFEIYVRPFPNVMTGRWQISTGGGTRPLWAPSGEELFYLAPTGALMRVGVERGPSWETTAPVQLFGRYHASTGVFTGRTYDVSPDGQRFLMVKPGGTDSTAAPTSLVVVQNWVEELKRLVPTR